MSVFLFVILVVICIFLCLYFCKHSLLYKNIFVNKLNVSLLDKTCMAFEANKVSDIKKSMEKEGRKIQMLFTKNRTV